MKFVALCHILRLRLRLTFVDTIITISNMIYQFVTFGIKGVGLGFSVGEIRIFLEICIDLIHLT